MLGRRKPGISIGIHAHETSCEIICVLSGKGKVFFNGEWEELWPVQPLTAIEQVMRCVKGKGFLYIFLQFITECAIIKPL